VARLSEADRTRGRILTTCHPMSIPTAVFLDTTVFDGQSYNFSSTAFSTFVPACKHRNLKLLLPDPTEREIKRHMSERTEEAITLIEQAHRNAPFLEKWNGFPPRDSRKEEAKLVRFREWLSFLKQFDVVRLNYDGITVAKVMNWYDAADPPFDKGKKRKEFPDAFTIAILSAYAEQNSCYIAVVSQRHAGKTLWSVLPPPRKSGNRWSIVMLSSGLQLRSSANSTRRRSTHSWFTAVP
jgi:hypothetical protein